MQIAENGFAAFRFRLLALVMLVGSTFLSLGLWAARWMLSRDPVYHFLGFNLFLAWLPFLFAAAMYWLHLRRDRSASDGLLVALGIAWLLFLPNAPYLWTDLVHVVIRRSVSVYWCDLVLGLTFGWNGMLLGLLSMLMVHRVIRDRLGIACGWAAVCVALALGSFSISIGRLERFNSWDVLTRPLALLAQTARIFHHPFTYSVHFAMAALFFAFLSMGYLLVLALFAAGREEAIPRRVDAARTVQMSS
ncbi:MAG TPA: DUF1361 domain-containing protein [Tepidisphaeraceae bacterium]|jgi:uncharacterized membrane protein